jgi:riboflavin kinase/FMN adenylyltransferase
VIDVQPTWIEDGAALGGPGRVVVIGNFDGVHRGHQALLAEAREGATAAGLEPCVLTFQPHPAVVLGRTPPPLLTTLERRAELLGRAGAAAVLVRRFDEAFARWSPEHFARELLAEALRAAVVVVGANFRFGNQRAGDLALLRDFGDRLGFAVRTATLRGDAEGPFSSTRVRAALAAGDVEAAALVLGRPHSITGRVVRGDQRGRKLGFPTANVGDVPELVPAHGVYAVHVDVESGPVRLPGVMNVGVRPTLGGALAPTREVHVLDWSGDLYGAHLRVHFVSRIREERRFDGLAALRAQIRLDAAEARARLSRGG